MPEIRLTNGGVAIVDEIDFPLISTKRWQRMPNALGFDCTYAYRFQKIDGVGRTFLMHRVILNAPKGLSVDHINGNGLDNRRANLRICTQSQNLANRAQQRNNRSSAYKGVSRTSRNRWRARCGREELGYFKSETEAAQAYNSAAEARYGQFAVLNVISARDGAPILAPKAVEVPHDNDQTDY